MTGDTIIWVFISIVFVVVLGGAIAYGAAAAGRRRRDRDTEAARDRATEKLFRETE